MCTVKTVAIAIQFYLCTSVKSVVKKKMCSRRTLEKQFPVPAYGPTFASIALMISCASLASGELG